VTENDGTDKVTNAVCYLDQRHMSKHLTISPVTSEVDRPNA